MKRLTYALVGCGRIAISHIEASRSNADRIRLTALCDIDPAAMEDALALSGYTAGEKAAVARYTDYRQMLRDAQPDLVAVATPSGLHCEVALAAIEAGCHVIVEKPIALSLCDADALIAAAKSRDVRLCANHQNRFNKAVRQVRGAVEAGRLGRLLHGTARIGWCRERSYYEQAAWRGTWTLDGGALMNQCIHNIDLLRWMMGDEVTEVFAYTDRLKHHYMEAEDLGLGLVRFKNGGYGMIEGTTNAFHCDLEETLTLFGEKGTVKIGGRSVNYIEAWNIADGLDEPAQVLARFAEDPPSVYGYGHAPLYADMADAILNHRPPYVDGEAGRRALELVLALYESARLGAPVKLPLADCSTLDSAGRFVGEAE